MNSKPTLSTNVQLPIELEQQLVRYRNSVWTSKTIEAVAIASCAVLTAFLCVFVLDRFADTPVGVRLTALALVSVGLCLLPLGIYRWVWRRRTLTQVARLISRQMPSAGGRLLGVLELVGDSDQQRRSPDLCHAAVEQVATQASRWDLAQSALPPRHKSAPFYALGLLVITVALGLAVPAASQSSWARLLTPWKTIARYSFASIAQVPASMVVAHGEPFTLQLELADGSIWAPTTGKVRVGDQQPLEARLQGRQYRFEIGGQVAETMLSVRIGDALHEIELLPTLRPELTAVVAHCTLPTYLGQFDKRQQDIRGGSLSLVTGSRASIQATADRELESVRIEGIGELPTETGVKGTEISSAEIFVDDSSTVQFQWTDTLGLEGKRPFQVRIDQLEDEPPTVSCQGLARQQVVLVTEQLRFDIQARDDFGVREVGMEWSGLTWDGSTSDFHGARALAAGGAERDVLYAAGTFAADKLGIEPQPVSLRIYAEDYLPERGRSYSPSYVLYVLSPDQHAIWLTEQLSKWHRRALEVRDRELQLYETNKQLRMLPRERLELSETRDRIQRQAIAERSNGRRLSQLTKAGEQLIQRATRNSEFGVGHLEKWAEMLQLLQQISTHRMPSVADLLKAAADSPQVAANAKNSPTAGVHRLPPKTAKAPQSSEKQENQPAVPQVVDAESSQQPPDPLANDSSSPQSSAATPSLTLPATTLMGKAQPGEACPVGNKMDDAIAEQRDLLAEFQRIANELNNILANLEGSSLVKRLKSASRQQYANAGAIGELVDSAFGFSGTLASNDQIALAAISEQEAASSVTVSYIMDDMQAYFQRRPFARFRTVIDEMSEADVVGNLRGLSEAIPEQQGLSMAQCEYWSDSLDRWAEDLVDPASGGT